MTITTFFVLFIAVQTLSIHIINHVNTMYTMSTLFSMCNQFAIDLNVILNIQTAVTLYLCLVQNTDVGLRNPVVLYYHTTSLTFRIEEKTSYSVQLHFWLLCEIFQNRYWWWCGLVWCGDLNL